jgi:signal transduction histidine kinase
MKDVQKTKKQLIDELTDMRGRLVRQKELASVFEILKGQYREEDVKHEKKSALDRLTANVAHEIRNPITVIGGLARKLSKSGSLNVKEKEYLEVIISEVMRTLRPWKRRV